jgi:hypothetical protein
VKYKVGDTVKIKTWEDMVEEFEYLMDDKRVISCGKYFTIEMEDIINERFPDRILTIERIPQKINCYEMKDFPSYNFSDDMIVGKEKKEIITRFHLMDFSDEI